MFNNKNSYNFGDVLISRFIKNIWLSSLIASMVCLSLKLGKAMDVSWLCVFIPISSAICADILLRGLKPFY